jgi:LmbE family N-acetylglucosaminyl deacetylase
MNLQTSERSPFNQPLSSPLYSVDIITTEPILVVAPHPDDETLGCGGAIAALRSRGLSLWVLVMSDGTKSHAHSIAYPAPQLKALRESETRKAMSLLGVDPAQITFFQLPDGAIPTPESTEFSSALARCCQYLSAVAPSIIFAPWRFDPHPDHRATWQLVNHALKQCATSSRLIEYPIWDWDQEQRCDSDLTIDSWRLDISQTLQIKQRAIAEYRSQTTDLINDDPQGFRLTPEMLTHFAQPWELYFEENNPMTSPDESLSADYFESLYQTDPDPWKFATSDYEAQKYQATLAALPHPRYQSAFEIGSSIGVLTEKLAQHCDNLLSIDVSETAQAQAIERCQGLSQVRFQIMQFPAQYPDEQFDLILLSEVGYYWNLADLKVAESRIIDCLKPEGHLLLVHWLPVSPGYPLTGDEVHDSFLEVAQLHYVLGQRTLKYRLDLFQK